MSILKNNQNTHYRRFIFTPKTSRTTPNTEMFRLNYTYISLVPLVLGDFHSMWYLFVIGVFSPFSVYFIRYNHDVYRLCFSKRYLWWHWSAVLSAPSQSYLFPSSRFDRSWRTSCFAGASSWGVTWPGRRRPHCLRRLRTNPGSSCRPPKPSRPRGRRPGPTPLQQNASNVQRSLLNQSRPSLWRQLNGDTGKVNRPFAESSIFENIDGETQVVFQRVHWKPVEVESHRPLSKVLLNKIRGAIVPRETKTSTI